MKEEKLTSKLRSKVTGMEGAKSYKLSRTEALQFVKEYFIDPTESNEQLDSLQLLPVFPMFKTAKCELNGWTCKRYILANSLVNHYMILFYDDKNVYSCGLFWLSSGSFKKSIKKMINEKKAALENPSMNSSKIAGDVAESNIQNAPKCPNCGAEIAENSKFCMKCGKPISEEPKANICPKCGAELQENAAFCMKCGAKIGE